MRPVSVPVTLAELPGQIERFGNTPYLLTVGADASPRATSVRVAWQGRFLTTGAGTRTAANIRENDAIVLLWPAVEPGEHALIVDARAEVQGQDVYIQPAKAVLHVTRH
jgi:hypothetical protein